MDKDVNNNLLKFADDTKLYGLANPDSSGTLSIQKDLNRLCDWAENWLMQFNTNNCKVMHFGKGNPCHEYTMNHEKLSVTHKENDLGVVIMDSLQVGKPCASVIVKANRMLGLIKRNIGNKSPEIMLKLHKTLVRPHLEYCTAVWSPHYKKDKNTSRKFSAELLNLSLESVTFCMRKD